MREKFIDRGRALPRIETRERFDLQATFRLACHQVNPYRE